ncbi:uncharacterized protein PAC_15230 [Phialocephala subalpina]|uniref:Uncharacterized protein n=1 Tax=Phialocephala subalpina TaxID=576137 RepID=A0A1L7XJV2_9HELO|nr:uncharacterized protein PAC_15230 [Phialocephala subalpina]
MVLWEPDPKGNADSESCERPVTDQRGGSVLLASFGLPVHCSCSTLARLGRQCLMRMNPFDQDACSEASLCGYTLLPDAAQTQFKADYASSRLTIRASEPNHSKPTNPPSEQLLNDSTMGDRSNNETVATQPEDGSKSLTDDTGVEPGGAKTPGEQGEDGVTVVESVTELPGSTSPCAARVTVEAPTNSQQSDLDSDKSTDTPAAPDFPARLGEPNGEAGSDADCQTSVFLDQNLVGDITLAATATFNDISLVDGSQDQPDADRGLLAPDCHAESEDKSACDSASNQSSLSTGVQATKPVESDNSGPGKTSPERPGKDIDSAIMIMDEEADQTITSDSATVIMDEEEQQTTKPQRTSHRSAAKRSFKDFVRSDNLWMSRTLIDLDDVMKLTDYVLASSEEVIKRAKLIKDQLIESQEFIKDCGGKEKKVTRRLEKP